MYYRQTFLICEDVINVWQYTLKQILTHCQFLANDYSWDQADWTIYI